MAELTVVRHGPTTLNESGRLRGWIDPPLSDAGLVHAMELSKLQPAGLVYCSDLTRAKQTAHCISTKWTATKALRPWNIGVYNGRPAHPAHEHLVYYQHNTRIRVPFGEAFYEFEHRMQQFISGIRGEALLVTHFRNCKLLQAWAATGWRYVSGDVMLKDDVKLCEVLRFTTPW
jgi:broad specificity phosphatase PhoE